MCFRWKVSASLGGSNVTFNFVFYFQSTRNPDANQRDDDSGSIDISDVTNPNDDRRSPTPEPTRKSPVKSASSLNDVTNDVIMFERSTSETDLNTYLKSSEVAPKLHPPYTEPPFQFLQEVNKMYTNSLEAQDIVGKRSTSGSNDNKSDTEVELDKRRTKSAKIKNRHLRKTRRNSNPNELTLAQKVSVYKRVMAFKDSCSRSSDC